MGGQPALSWHDRYVALTDPQTGPLGTAAIMQSGVFLCGVSACVDARVDMHDMQPLFDAPKGSPAAALSTLLLSRAKRGVGGEVRYDWPAGPAFIRDHLTVSYALGGTGPQAAWVLAALGARSLVALEDRHAQMLKLLPQGILLAAGEAARSPDSLLPSGPHIPEIFIFEFTAGRPLADFVPPRSSRVIIRFCDRGIQRDDDFEKLSCHLAPTAAAGLISGLNDEPKENVASASRHVFALSRNWRAAGLQTVHLELACYASLDAVEELLGEARGAISSLGMSHTELLSLFPGAENPMDAMISLGDRLDLGRVCVHADTWAAAVTLNSTEIEMQALMAGCAVASARAANGVPARAFFPSPDAIFEPLPFEAQTQAGRWTFVACASPYVRQPRTTLGLGDSFTAGCLLVLGNATRRTENRSQTCLKENACS